MREIKFRAWYKLEKRMEIVDQLRFIHGGYEMWTNWSVDRGATCPDNSELMQFVGLYDKNGKEIYEGDIVREKYGLEEGGPDWLYYEVKFGKSEDCRWGFYLDNDGDEVVFKEDFERLEVIGNIYENGDLLNDH